MVSAEVTVVESTDKGVESRPSISDGFRRVPDGSSRFATGLWHADSGGEL